MSQPLASFQIQISSGIQDFLNAIFHSVPKKILVFLSILLIGWFVATASIVLVALGVSAALSQLGLTAALSRPVLYTVLLTCGAIIAIGVGGGLIKPMQAHWERMLTAAGPEASDEAAAGRPSHAGQDQGQDQRPQGYLQPQRTPSYLQTSGFSRGPGYLPTFDYLTGGHPSVQAPETDVLDDADYNPGGQYM